MEPLTGHKIYIQWKGPFSCSNLYNGLSNNDDTFNDKGVYQIYGHHPLYGSDALLYIGKTFDTFYNRLNNNHLDYYECSVCDTQDIRIYIGRLVGNKPENDEKWQNEINIAEQLLIIAHKPATNTSGIKWWLQDVELQDYLIVNRGNYRSLMPEIYGERYVLGRLPNFKECLEFYSKKGN